MDTKAKPAEPRATDRLLQALSTLAALLDRTINEVKTLEADLESRIQQAVSNSETFLQQQAAAHLQVALEDADRTIRAQVAEEMKSLFEGDLSTAVDAVQQQLKAEREKLNKALERAAESTREYEAERNRLQTECDRANEALSEAQAKVQTQAKAAAAAKPAPTAAPGQAEKLAEEIERIEGQIKEISTLIDDPTTDLSTVIRKNVERAELDAYLKGIRFTFNGK